MAESTVYLGIAESARDLEISPATPYENALKHRHIMALGRKIPLLPSLLFLILIVIGGMICNKRQFLSFLLFGRRRHQAAAAVMMDDDIDNDHVEEDCYYGIHDDHAVDDGAKNERSFILLVLEKCL